MGKQGLIRVPQEATFGQAIAILAVNAHGPPTIIVPNQQFGAADLVVAFTCMKGERHTFQYVRTPEGEGFLTEVPDETGRDIDVEAGLAPGTPNGEPS